MRLPVVLVTGVAGEIGHALVHRLSEEGGVAIVGLDLRPLDGEIERRLTRAYTGSITDSDLLDRILAEYAVERIFHLAALLSTRGEFTPVTAHQVNVEGTLHLLEFAQAQARSHGRPVLFLYPSSIAAYGVDARLKNDLGPLEEHVWNQPITMYGCNKLYCELLGRYYARHYRQLDAEQHAGRVDFRSLRYPGLISAFTVPSGGTSDFAPEMIHSVAQSRPYACFVREDTRIPFMVMPDAVDAMLGLARADREKMTQTVYNVSAFNPSAGEFRALVLEAYPGGSISYAPDVKRQRIVDSWPAAVDDSAARRDWNFSPRFDLESAFEDYLLPTIRERYGR